MLQIRRQSPEGPLCIDGQLRELDIQLLGGSGACSPPPFLNPGLLKLPTKIAERNHHTQLSIKLGEAKNTT
jgi:hypothetical protein